MCAGSAFEVGEISRALAKSAPPAHPLSKQSAFGLLKALAVAAPDFCEIAASDFGSRRLFRTKERSVRALLRVCGNAFQRKHAHPLATVVCS